MTFHRTRRVMLAGIAAILASTTLVAAPAQAHSELVSSDPANGAVLDAAPTSLTLTFNEAVLDGGAQLLATADNGATVDLPTPTVNGTTVSAPWPATAPAGAYTVVYRVVSADGHPVSDQISFTYRGAAATGTTTAAASASTAAAAATTPAPATATATTAAATAEGTSSSTFLWLAGLLALLVVAGAAIAFGLNRGRDSHEDAAPK